MLFTAHRPTGLKTPNWNCFFPTFFFKLFFSLIFSIDILVNIKIKRKKKKIRPTDWLFLGTPGGQETIFYLRGGLKVQYFFVQLNLGLQYEYVRDWSLITGRGGYKTGGGGGHVKFYRYEKGGQKKF